MTSIIFMKAVWMFFKPNITSPHERHNFASTKILHSHFKWNRSSEKGKGKGRFIELFNTAALMYSYPQQFSAFISRGATHHRDARDLYQRRREILPMNFARKSVIHERTRFFYMPQSWDMRHILLLPLRRKGK